MLLILFDVRVIQRRRRILVGIVIGDEAIRLEPLHRVINLAERELCVADSRPTCGPSVENQRGDRTVLGEKLSELGLDESDLLGRDVMWADVRAQVEDRVIETDRESRLSERVDVATHD